MLKRGTIDVGFLQRIFRLAPKNRKGREKDRAFAAFEKVPWRGRVFHFGRYVRRIERKERKRWHERKWRRLLGVVLAELGRGKKEKGSDPVLRKREGGKKNDGRFPDSKKARNGTSPSGKGGERAR